VHFRGLEFTVPEFPRSAAGDNSEWSTPPPELGEHTASVLKAAGVADAEYEALIKSGAIAAAEPNAFAWAAVRRDG